MKLRSGRLTKAKATKITEKRVAIKKAPKKAYKKKTVPKKRPQKPQAVKPPTPPRAPLKRLKRLDELEEERKVENEYIETVFPGLIAANERRERLSQQDIMIDGVWYSMITDYYCLNRLKMILKKLDKTYFRYYGPLKMTGQRIRLAVEDSEE